MTETSYKYIGLGLLAGFAFTMFWWAVLLFTFNQWGG